MAIRPLKGISLCAGIGGIDLGLRAAIGASYKTICYVERDAYLAAVLAARMGEGYLDDAPIWSDLKTFRAKPWRGAVDIITAGYPCQPFSQAGAREGEQDPRHLWPYIAKHIRAIKPSYVFCENVPGHLTLGFKQVCHDLRRMGYGVKAGIFSAEECGAQHQRQRLFFLAYAHGIPLRHATKRQRKTSGQGKAKSSLYGNNGGLGFSGTSKSSVCRVAYDVSNRMDRHKALGNAVVPATAKLAWVTLTKELLRG